MSTVWEDLVSDALVGTERRPYTSRPLVGGLAGVAGSAGDLIGLASAVWAYREVGRLPLGAPPGGSAAPPPAPPDDRPLLPPATVRSLAAVVGQPNRRALLGEWLQLAAADGRRLPPERVPVLLDLASGEIRADLEAAAGPLAGWLAAQRPGWAEGGVSPRAASLAGAVLAGVAPAWDGTDEDRVAALALVRAADPAVGRQLLERVWYDEPAATRAAMVAGLGSGLSGQDEPFLEERLDDRRKEVRLAAAGLLARLPDSRYAGRMAARARAGVRFSGRARAAWRFEPPAELDWAARRDGVTAAASQPDRWLLQVAGAAALSAWPDPETLVPAAVRAGAVALVTAWTLAAERQRDVGWARRLLAAGAPPTAGLLGVLPPAEAESFLLAWLDRAGLAGADGVLTELPEPWTAAVTDAVMASLAGLVASGDHGPPAAAVRAVLARFALACDPRRVSSVAAVARTLEGLPDARRPAARLFWGSAVTSLNALVHFRQAMHQEFQEP